MSSMSDPTPSQSIGNVSARDGAQVAAGTFHGNVTFSAASDSKGALEEAVKSCRNSLLLTYPAIDRESIIRVKGERVPGTCEWIAENGTYRSWVEGEMQLLWICGGPGKGKTMLSIYLTRELERQKQLIYFFCSNDDDRRNNAAVVLRSLLWQITGHCPDLTEQMLQYFDTKEKTQVSLSSVDLLWSVFVRLCRDPKLGATVCVLDGLDECDEDSTNWLAAKLVGFTSSDSEESSNNALKVVIVSRDISGLRRSAQVKLDPDSDQQVSADIRSFVSTRVQELSGLIGFDESFSRHVEDTLLARAEGTFLYVGFAMAELLKKRTRKQVEETLSDLPTGLRAIYGRMLVQIESSQRHVTSLILRWVTLAIRPLSLLELAAAVGIEATSMLTTEQAMRDQLVICSPFLVVKEQGVEEFDYEEVGLLNRPTREGVSLVHQSAREYLFPAENDQYAAPDGFRVTLEEGNLHLAWTCLDCLQVSTSPRRPLDVGEGGEAFKLEENPLLLYASLYWSAHARDALKLAKRLMEHPSLFFSTKSELREKWWQTFREKDLTVSSASLPALHTACYLGIVPWAQALLSTRKWKLKFTKAVNERDSQQWTGLFYAARNGHTGLVQLLLEHRADINAKALGGETALYVAATGGHEAVVRLLLVHKADVSTDDLYGRTALNVAASGGHKAMVRLLLEYKADVNTEDLGGRTALYVAAIGGHKAVVRLLLEHKAHINTKDSVGRTALFGAAIGGDEATVRLLLEHKAHINTKDSYGQTALHKAASRGDEAIVRLLLERKADINAKDSDGDVALHKAACRGHEAIVRILRDREETCNQL